MQFAYNAGPDQPAPSLPAYRNNGYCSMSMNIQCPDQTARLHVHHMVETSLHKI